MLGVRPKRQHVCSRNNVYSYIRFLPTGISVASIERTYRSNSGRSSSPKTIPGISWSKMYFGLAVCNFWLTTVPRLQLLGQRQKSSRAVGALAPIASLNGCQVSLQSSHSRETQPFKLTCAFLSSGSRIDRFISTGLLIGMAGTFAEGRGVVTWAA